MPTAKPMQTAPKTVARMGPPLKWSAAPDGLAPQPTMFTDVMNKGNGSELMDPDGLLP
jgi:hypothetical protein